MTHREKKVVGLRYALCYNTIWNLFPRFLSRKEDVLACCPSRAVSLRLLALELVETSANYSALLEKDP
jgi:hypothetical protein